MKVSEFLKEAKSLIDTREKWTQGKYACDATGLVVSSISPTATCFCSIGALHAIAHAITDEYFDEYPYKFEIKAKNYLANSMDGSIWVFNDSHTHEEVMQAWDKAIKKAEEDEAFHSR